MANPPKSVGLFRKFVSTARSITTGQVGLPLGIIRLDRNLIWLAHHDIKPLSKEELGIIKAYYELIKEFPIEQEGLHWAPEALQRVDGKLKCITVKYQARLMGIVTRIVAEAS